MSQEGKNVVRLLALTLIFLAVCSMALLRIRHLERQVKALENAPTDTVTVVRHDTIKIDSPVPIIKYVKQKEYIAIHDTTLVTETDTVTQLIQLPREYLVYKDTTYRAVVSGVQPRLDSLEIYRKTETQIITKTITKTKKTRWGLGVQTGMGWNGKKIQPHVGVGLQFNVLSW